MKDYGGYLGYTPLPSTASASGVWPVDEQRRYAGMYKWPVPLSVDPIQSNIALWLKADAGVLDATSSAITADSTAVATWVNQSGSGQNATQSTSGSRPVWRNGSNGINGLPVIQFNGSSSVMTGSDTGFPSGSQPRTVYWIARYRTLNAGWGGWSYGVTGASNVVFGMVKSSSASGNYASIQGWVNDYPSSYAITANTTFVHSAVLNGTSLTQFINGTSVYSGTSSHSTTLSNFRIGAETNSSSFQAIDVLEILLYNAAHTSTERSSVEAYLKTRAGV